MKSNLTIEQKDELFKGIKQRIKTWIIPLNLIKEEERLKISASQKCSTEEITFWDFLSYSYGFNDDTTIKVLLYWLAFENTVINSANQYTIKMISILNEIDGNDEGEKTSLLQLLDKKTIDAQDLIRG